MLYMLDMRTVVKLLRFEIFLLSKLQQKRMFRKPGRMLDLLHDTWLF